MKVLFLIPYPLEGASCRYRIYQFLPFLEKEGIHYTISPFISKKFHKILYKHGALLKKITYFSQGMGRRLLDFMRLPFYDAIFIHLESLPFPLFPLEYLAKICRKPIIYDFDDAIFLRKENSKNIFLNVFKSHRKIPKRISLSSRVIVGNQHLKDFASHHINENKISIVPTSIDTEKFKIKNYNNPIPIIGWIGSHSTFPYLEDLLDIFPILSKNFNFILNIIGAPSQIQLPGVQILQKEWTLEEETCSFSSLDIGIYPLRNTEWVRKSKIGFKAMQYMASQIPCIATDIGFNKDIIIDGVNIFLARNKEEWIKKISLLLSSPNLRKEMGEKGRKTAEQHFSLKIYSSVFTHIIKDPLQKNI